MTSLDSKQQSSQKGSAPNQVATNNRADAHTTPDLGDRYEDMIAAWQQRLKLDLPKEGEATREAVVQWLVGEAERFEPMDLTEIKLVKRAMDYRYRIFLSRYWGLSPERAYKKLLQKLGGLFLIRSKIRVWIALSRDRKRAVRDVLQEVIQEMLQSDKHMRSQTAWIGQCTDRASLRNILTLATIEEYCLRPIRNQPLLVYRFVNYLRRSQRGGMTQVPSAELIHLISEEIGTDAADGTLSLLDFEALGRYEVQKKYENQQTSRELVKQQFSDYLGEKLGNIAVQWLALHLQGYAQDSISRQLGLSVREAYRLREKISYHAIRIFTIKAQPDLVFSWLKTSPNQHNLGLTPTEWNSYWKTLSPDQQTLLDAFKAGKNVSEIAETFNLTAKQVTSKWAEIYMIAQETRMAKENSG